MYQYIFRADRKSEGRSTSRSAVTIDQRSCPVAVQQSSLPATSAFPDPARILVAHWTLYARSLSLNRKLPSGGSNTHDMPAKTLRIAFVHPDLGIGS